MMCPGSIPGAALGPVSFPPLLAGPFLSHKGETPAATGAKENGSLDDKCTNDCVR